MFGFDDFTELSKPRDLEKIFDSAEYIPWRRFRESEDSRFVTLTMPRVLARLPYGASTKPVEDFNFEEADTNEEGKHVKTGHDSYCWMNAAYSLALFSPRPFPSTVGAPAFAGPRAAVGLTTCPAIPLSAMTVTWIKNAPRKSASPTVVRPS